MARRAKRPEKGMSFEEALARLEGVVRDLEGGSLPLEEALAVFQEGVGLVRTCQERLRVAEEKLKELVEEEGNLRLLPLSLPGREGGAGDP